VPDLSRSVAARRLRQVYVDAQQPHIAGIPRMTHQPRWSPSSTTFAALFEPAFADAL